MVVRKETDSTFGQSPERCQGSRSPQRQRRDTLPAPMSDVLEALVAFAHEHQRCGDLDSGTDNGYVWMQCSCGGLITQPAAEPPRHPAASWPA